MQLNWKWALLLAPIFMASYYFKYQEHPIGGYRSHYFHFLLGYFLPAIHQIEKLQLAPESQIVVDDCGPIMNSRWREWAKESQMDLQIGLTETRLERTELVARWDYLFLFQKRSKLWLERIKIKYGLGGAPSYRDLIQLRTKLLASYGGATKSHWLLLKRSPAPKFYDQVSASNPHPGYGSNRRAIANFEQVAKGLISSGIPIKVVDAGSLSFADQIKVFSEAKGIIGIRGAEMSNSIWMGSDQSLIMLMTPMERENHGTRNINSLFGAKFIPIPVNSEFPILKTKEIIPYLK
jgi:hypothetical protein